MRRREFIALFGSAAAVWPLTAYTEQAARPVVGFLSASSPADRAPLLAALRQGLAETSYVENSNVAITYRFAEGHYDRLAGFASDLVKSGVAVLVAGDGVAALAAKAATTTIPVVFNTGIDPLQVGLVAHLERPEGNLTGVNLTPGPLAAKLLGLLHDVVPKATTIAPLVNPENANAEADTAIVQGAAGTIGVKIILEKAVAESDLEAIFASFAQSGINAAIVDRDVFFTARRDLIVALAARYATPAIYPWREFVASGGLMSYDTSISAAYRQIGIYVGNILKGAKVADLR